MLDKDAEAEVQSNFDEASMADSEQSPSVDKVSATPHAIRYLDDAEFRDCLEKVVTTHSRLLSKLAE